MSKPIHPEDLNFANKAVGDFSDEYLDKFHAGAEEHFSKGPFENHNLEFLIKNAKQEVLDQWSYIKAIEYKMQRARDILQVHITRLRTSGIQVDPIIYDLHIMFNGK